MLFLYLFSSFLGIPIYLMVVSFLFIYIILKEALIQEFLIISTKLKQH